jgi:hypothetical protein
VWRASRRTHRKVFDELFRVLFRFFHSCLPRASDLIAATRMLSHNRVLGLVVALALVCASARAFNSCLVDLGSYQVDLNPLATFPSNFSVTSTNGQNIVFRVCSNMTCPNTPYGSVDSGVCQRQSSGSSTSWGVYKSWMQASPLWDQYQSGISLRLFGGTNGAQAEINIYCDPNAWYVSCFIISVPWHCTSPFSSCHWIAKHV